MHDEFRTLCEDERFRDLPMRLKRHVDLSEAMKRQQRTYAIVVGHTGVALDVVADLQRFAAERGLRAQLHSTGQIELRQP